MCVFVRFADINNNNNDDADDIFCPSPSQLKLEKVLLKLYKNIDGFLSDFIKRFIILCV